MDRWTDTIEIVERKYDGQSESLGNFRQIEAVFEQMPNVDDLDFQIHQNLHVQRLQLG